MKALSIIASIYLIAAAPGNGFGATTFQNLGFDDGPVPNGVSDGDTAVFLPGWRLTYNGVSEQTIGIDTINADFAGFATLGHSSSSPYLPYVGRYTLYMGNRFYDGAVETWSLSQQGFLDENVRTITFLRSLSFGFDPPVLSINGTVLPLASLGWAKYSGYDVFGADISAFAGQEVELTFSTPPLLGGYSIDEIQFSTITIPEPRPLLLGIAAASILIVFRKRRVLKRMSGGFSARFSAAAWRFTKSAAQTRLLLAVALFHFFAMQSLAASAEFQNLGFDDGPLPEIPQTGDVAEFLPGWSLTYDGGLVSKIDVNGLGNAGATLGRVFMPYSGRYALYLRSEFQSGTVHQWAVSQTGFVDPNSRSITFLSNLGGLHPELRINGEALTALYFGRSTSPGLDSYAADISSFAGQTVEISFSTPLIPAMYSLDDIQFSPVPVPEPAPLCLLISGLLLQFASRHAQFRKWPISFLYRNTLMQSATLIFVLANITCTAQSFQNPSFDAGPLLTEGQQGNTYLFLPGRISYAACDPRHPSPLYPFTLGVR